jgi:hypothetical protein
MNYNAQKLAGEALAAENRLLSRAIGCVNSSDVPAGMHFISFRLNSQRVGRRGDDVLSNSVDQGRGDTPLFVDPFCGAAWQLWPLISSATTLIS